jgi:hypothetical protein
MPTETQQMPDGGGHNFNIHMHNCVLQYLYPRSMEAQGKENLCDEVEKKLHGTLLNKVNGIMQSETSYWCDEEIPRTSCGAHLSVVKMWLGD